MTPGHVGNFLGVSESPSDGRESGTNCKHSHLLPQTLSCPGFLAAETQHDPS